MIFTSSSRQQRRATDWIRLFKSNDCTIMVDLLIHREGTKRMARCIKHRTSGAAVAASNNLMLVSISLLLLATGNHTSGMAKNNNPQSSMGASAFVPPLQRRVNVANRRQHAAPLPSPGDHRRLATFYRSAPAKCSQLQMSNEGAGGGDVIFQKVVRPPPYLSSDQKENTGLANAGNFLGGLVTYLEYGLEVPDGLIPYDKILPEDNNNADNDGMDLFDDEYDDIDSEDDHTVCIFDSPLSSDPSDSRLCVEVVAVYPEADEGQRSQQSQSPTMAMVVVKKPQSTSPGGSSSSGSSNVMVAGLFDDAKKRIIKALDMGLDDWSEGRVRAEDGGGGRGGASTYTVASPSKKKRPSDVDEDMEEEPYTNPAAVAGAEDVFERTEVQWERAIIDAEVIKSDPYTSVEDTKKKKKKGGGEGKGASAGKKKATGESNKSVPPVGYDDYAVQAAKRAATAAARKAKSGSGTSTTSSRDDAVSTTKNTRTVKAEGGKKKRASKKKPARTKTARQQQTPLPIASMADSASSSVEMSPSGPRFRVSLNRPKRPGQERSQKSGARSTIKASEKRTVGGKDSQSTSRVEAFLDTTPRNNGKAKDSTAHSNNDISAPAVKVPSGQDYAVAAAKAAAEAKGIGSKTNGKAETPNGSTGKRRKINAVEYDSDLSAKEGVADFDNIMFDGKPDTKRASGSIASTDGGKTKTDAEIERDVMAEAVKFMPDSDDMSAEQLLKDVLKFGDEMDKEEATGTGFATGAIDKAKDLLQESTRKRKEQKSRSSVAFKEPQSLSTSQQEFFDNLESTMQQDDEDDDHSGKPLSTEEELKKIFAAGERLAEGKIMSTSTSTSDDGLASAAGDRRVVTDEYIDELIASDKTVPRNARLLDEELAQLEVRMSKSVDEGEGLGGGRGPNPLWDVMSGPETYNPNVADPTTAVNWPGAQPGTRNDIRLPPELDEAVKNARFAAKVLVEMTEVVDEDGEERKYFVGEKELSQKQVDDVRKVVEEAVAVGLIEDPLVLMAERARLNILVKELKGQDDRFGDIASEYKDLLLSDNFIPLVRQYLNAMIERDLESKRKGIKDAEINSRHQEEREIITKLVEYAQVLLKQVRALGAELEASHLEVIRSICQVAMDPSHSTEEETELALTDAVQDMRAMFDDSFVAYLKYAIAEEEAKLARAGVLDDPEYNRWLFVLKIIQEGVYKELAKSINRLIEHIWYVLRMESKSERRMLLEKLVDVMPSLDVRPFVSVVDNIVSSLGGATKGEFDADVVGDMTNKLLQLHRDVKEILPSERIKEMSKDADEWAESRRKRLMEARETTQKRLANAAETDSFDPDQPGTYGEIERMT